MPSDYAAIRRENELEYGRAIARTGKMLLANRYDDRSHFIFELLQNTEDALRRRPSSDLPRTARFRLMEDGLEFSHFGLPFTPQDVRGVCGIGESTKSQDATAIGRFGIGFKAVYAFTDHPEVHSGDEHFVIENYVLPQAAPPRSDGSGETTFWFPFRPDDPAAAKDALRGLNAIRLRTLLFLREIEEIVWTTRDGTSHRYTRSARQLTPAARLVRITSATPTEEASEEWLIFSRQVKRGDQDAGHVEIAFALEQTPSGKHSIKRIDDSTLTVYFPTIVPTYVGFLLHAPFQTTPSRDNVPRDSQWNKELVETAADLLIESLRHLKAVRALDASLLRVLPTDPTKFSPESLFEPLFARVREALKSEDLLPSDGGDHTSAANLAVPRGKDLRGLLTPQQLGRLRGRSQPVFWATPEITIDRTPELHRYLTAVLGVPEIEPASLLRAFTEEFLHDQTNEWIEKLYRFLNGQLALDSAAKKLPIFRLSDGSHAPLEGPASRPTFLPGRSRTSFQTIHSDVCVSADAIAYLKRLGLAEPDLVDDVIENILPKYQLETVEIETAEYRQDFNQWLQAMKTQHRGQRSKLVDAFRASRVVQTVDAGTGKISYVRPTEAYQSTSKLRDLFLGISGILLVNDSEEIHRGDEARALFEAMGVPQYLVDAAVATRFDWQGRAALREKSGSSGYTRDWSPEDHTLRGLDQVLDVLPKLSPMERATRASLLWSALVDVAERRGASAFKGSYSWFYYSQKSCQFEAAFVERLNREPWIPDSAGVLHPPHGILFERAVPPLEPHPVLLSYIRFRPPLVESLAREAGLDPEVLTLLKQLDVTDAAGLLAKLRPDAVKGRGHPPDGESEDGESEDDESEDDESEDDESEDDESEDDESEDDESEDDESQDDESQDDESQDDESQDDESQDDESENDHESGGRAGDEGEGGAPGKKRRRKKKAVDPEARDRPFISYVASSPDEEVPDPDGLSRERRLALEDSAIEFILELEPSLVRTTQNNEGFDLVELDSDDSPVRWVEVKAMSGSLDDRPVGLSRAQFSYAGKYRTQFWLYIVEFANEPARRRVVRVNDPAGRVKTFTFDKGWRSIAG